MSMLTVVARVVPTRCTVCVGKLCTPQRENEGVFHFRQGLRFTCGKGSYLVLTERRPFCNLDKTAKGTGSYGDRVHRPSHWRRRGGTDNDQSPWPGYFPKPEGCGPWHHWADGQEPRNPMCGPTCSPSISVTKLTNLGHMRRLLWWLATPCNLVLLWTSGAPLIGWKVKRRPCVVCIMRALW